MYHNPTGKQKGEILSNANKNVVTDVIVPMLAIGLTILLLIKFNWVGQFTLTSDSGETSANIFAIVAMLLGYIILPFGLLIWKKVKNI